MTNHVMIAEVSKVQKHLESWLKYRNTLRNAGKSTIYGPAAQRLDAELRKAILRHDSAAQLPSDTEELVKYALYGAAGPLPQGVWPIILAAGVVVYLIVSRAFGYAAERAETEARYDCIKAGLCSEPTNWGRIAKAGAVGVGTFLVRKYAPPAVSSKVPNWAPYAGAIVVYLLNL